MGFFDSRAPRERRRADRNEYKRRLKKRMRSIKSRSVVLRPSMLFFLAFTFFMAVNLRSRLHPRALRGQRSSYRLFPWRRSSWHRPATRWQRIGSVKRQSHRKTMPVNWHAIAAQRAMNGKARVRNEHAHRSDSSSGFTFSKLGIEVSVGGINASAAVWKTLPDRVLLPALNRSDFPWLHKAHGRAIAPPLDRASSIFAALRKGRWMGCSRSNALLCTGVYRALKRSAASSVFDVDCSRHLSWLPKVIDKLLEEYRLVRVICAYGTEAQHARAVSAWSTRRNVRFVHFVPATAKATDFVRADVALARESLRGNLILAMRFLKLLKAAKTSMYLIHENFPRETMNVPTASGLKMNAALPPFSLPPPFYSHSDPDNVFGVQVSIRMIEEMFEMRTTPSMADLVDPRKRRVLE